LPEFGNSSIAYFERILKEALSGRSRIDLGLPRHICLRGWRGWRGRWRLLTASRSLEPLSKRLSLHCPALGSRDTLRGLPSPRRLLGNSLHVPWRLAGIAMSRRIGGRLDSGWLDSGRPRRIDRCRIYNLLVSHGFSVNASRISRSRS
jgi:hypothetical protein